MKKISQSQLDTLSEEAKKSPRKRAYYRLHEHADPVLKLLNALEPATYLPPHKHAENDRQELFVSIRGRIAVIFFDDRGTITEYIIIGPKEKNIIVEIPVGSWHTTVALMEGSIILEVIKGPYDANTHKRNAPWAPEESQVKAASEYLTAIKNTLHYET
jgi:cupin fold WbuC family metalloprotein